MLTIKNTKLFNYIQEIHVIYSKYSLLEIITNKESEFYISCLPVIDVRDVVIHSDCIIFYDRGFSGMGIFRDNTFKIEEE